MLITLMPETPKAAKDRAKFGKLPGVLQEKDQIIKMVSPHVKTTVRIASNADDILNRLEHCQIAHFACHGTSDSTDPSNSALVLQRAGLNGMLEQDHLSVRRISHQGLRNAQIAYLAACSTAENKGARLRDEVIHVVSGFQVAGFPNVVGSLWSAGDGECVKVATRSYSSLFKHGGMSAAGGRRVAEALHGAVMAVRAGDMDMPLNWAQFVHFGA
jgi:CHAT domain-containing protein